MMKHILAIMAVASTATALASPIDIRNDVQIQRNTLGSGQQGVTGFESSTLVLDNDIFHAPQYMPYHPTAGTIYPRVVEVPCMKTFGGLKCEGYNWLPKMGRGEYLFFKPVIVEEPKPVIVEKTIIKEVPVKKIRQ